MTNSFGRRLFLTLSRQLRAAPPAALLFGALILAGASAANAQPTLPSSADTNLAVRLEDPLNKYEEVSSDWVWHNHSSLSSNYDAIQTIADDEPSLLEDVFSTGADALSFRIDSGDSEGLVIHHSGFDGTGGGGDLAFDENNGAEVFIVIRALNAFNPLQDDQPWLFGTGSVGRPEYPGDDDPNDTDYREIIKDGTFSDTLHEVAASQQVLEIFHIYNVSSSKDEWTARINDRVLYSSLSNQQDSKVPDFSSSTRFFYIGRASETADNNAADCDIACVLVYNKVLDGEERQDVYTYLNYQYDLITEVPEAPTEVSAKPLSETQISLRWYTPPAEDVVNTGPIFFDVERRAGLGGIWKSVETVKNERSYIDTYSFSLGTEYFYRVKAWRYNRNGTKSEFSEVVSATPTSEYGDVDFPESGTPEPLVWLVGENSPPGIRGTVGTWLDRSANYQHHARAYGTSEHVLTSQPQQVDWEPGEPPSLRFNGQNVLLLPPLMFDTGSGPWPGSSLEMFCVLRASDTNNNVPWNLGRDGATRYPQAEDRISDTFFSDDNPAHSSGSPAQPLGEFHLYNVWADADNWVSRINGRVHHVARDNTIPSNMTTDPLIGANTTPGITAGDGFAGDIAALLIFDQALTAQERYVVGSHLNHVYGLVEEAPSTPTLLLKPLSDDQIALSWVNEDATIEEWRLGGLLYDVERKPDAGGPWANVATLEQSRNYLDTGLSATTAYDYRVRARNLAGMSAWSDEKTTETLSSGDGYPTGKELLWVSADHAPAGKMGAWPHTGAQGTNNLESDSAHGLQATTAQQPTLMENSLYYKPVLSFEDHYLDFGSVFSGINNTDGSEAFIVVHVNDQEQNSDEVTFWKAHADANILSQYYPYWISSGFIYVFDTFGFKNDGYYYSDNLVPLGIDLSRYMIYNVSAKDGEWRLALSGTEALSSPYNILSSQMGFPDPFWVGASHTVNPGSGDIDPHFVGDIAAAVFFDEVLTSSERAAVNDYLKLIWGLGDEDNDSLPDYWEAKYNISGDGPTDDSDSDGLLNYDEFLLGTNPIVRDTDDDGLWDGTETTLALNRSPGPTDPLNPDTDFDGMSDGWEVSVNEYYDDDYLNPVSLPGDNEAQDDPDNDGLTNLEEHDYFFNVLVGHIDYDTDIDNGEFDPYGVFLDPFDPDCNLDGTLDGVSVWTGIDPLDNDVDGDGWSNYSELTTHFTNPHNADTDYDGCDEGTGTGADDYPLDPAIGCASAPPSVGGNPSITWGWPVHATP